MPNVEPRLRILTCLIGIVATVTSFAQTKLDLRDPIPSISFEEWKEVGDSNRWREYVLSFPSAYVSPEPINNTVPLRIFIPKPREADEPVKPYPVVLILHYWGAKDIKVERSMADQFAQRGIASVILTLPYHLARTPEGFRSGELAIQPSGRQTLQSRLS